MFRTIPSLKPGSYYNKPPSPILQRGHPLSKGLIHAYTLHEGGADGGRDWIKNIKSTFSASVPPTWNTGFGGRGVKFINSEAGSVMNLGQNITLLNKTFLFVIYKTSEALVSTFAGNGALNDNYMRLENNNFHIDNNTGGNHNFATSTQGLHVWVVTYDNVNFRLFKDGIFLGSSAVAGSNFNCDRLGGSRGAANDTLDGFIHLFLVWDSNIASGAVAKTNFNIDPYSMFRSRIPYDNNAVAAGVVTTDMWYRETEKVYPYKKKMVAY